MERFDFIEAALIFAIKDNGALNKIPFGSKDFKVHGDVFGFVKEYNETHNMFPTDALLLEKFPILDKSAIGTTFDYALEQLKKQIVYRKTVDAIRSSESLLKEEPQKAVKSIIDKLETINIGYGDDDIYIYDSGALDRLNDYQARQEKRNTKTKMLGIPTPIRTINKTGIGWMPGEVISIFARPTVGKTWLCVKIAAVSMMHGYRTLFVTLEMPQEQIGMRLDVVLARMHGCNISHTALRKGDGLDKEEYKKFLGLLQNRHLLLCDHIAQEEITLSSVKTLVRKHKPSLVILDGIHLLSLDNASKAIWEKMFVLFYGLKSFCRSNKIACVVSTQANRSAYNLYSPPKIKDVAFGDALVQASDIAFSMSMMEGQDKQRSLQIQKYRDGILPADYVVLDWDVDIGIIKERDLSNENKNTP